MNGPGSSDGSNLLSTCLFDEVTCHGDKSGGILNTCRKLLVLHEKFLEVNVQLVEETVLDGTNDVCESSNV